MAQAAFPGTVAGVHIWRRRRSWTARGCREPSSSLGRGECLPEINTYFQSRVWLVDRLMVKTLSSSVRLRKIMLFLLQNPLGTEVLCKVQLGVFISPCLEKSNSSIKRVSKEFEVRKDLGCGIDGLSYIFSLLPSGVASFIALVILDISYWFLPNTVFYH